MFKRVTAQELPQVLAFLKCEPDINHFILGDLEVFGLADPNLTLWAEQPLTAVLRQYGGSFSFYAPGGADWDQAAHLMKQAGYGALSGRPEFLQPLLERLGDPLRLETHILMALDPGELIQPAGSAAVVRVTAATLEQHLPGIAALRRGISEFHTALNVDALREEVALGCKRVALIERDGTVASMAMTNERADAAMIVSVCTANAYRGLGYAGQVTAALCQDLAREGKRALLFFMNPSAGRVYTALGFRDIGRWMMVSF